MRVFSSGWMIHRMNTHGKVNRSLFLKGKSSLNGLLLTSLVLSPCCLSTAISVSKTYLWLVLTTGVSKSYSLPNQVAWNIAGYVKKSKVGLRIWQWFYIVVFFFSFLFFKRAVSNRQNVSQNNLGIRSPLEKRHFRGRKVSFMGKSSTKDQWQAAHLIPRKDMTHSSAGRGANFTQENRNQTTGEGSQSPVVQYGANSLISLALDLLMWQFKS